MTGLSRVEISFRSELRSLRTVNAVKFADFPAPNAGTELITQSVPSSLLDREPPREHSEKDSAESNARWPSDPPKTEETENHGISAAPRTVWVSNSPSIWSRDDSRMGLKAEENTLQRKRL